MSILGEEEFRADESRLEQISEFKHLGCVLDESGTNVPDCHNQVVNGRKVASAIRFLVNTSCLQLECARVLQEGLFVPILCIVLIWREKKISSIIQMDSLRGLLVIRRVDGVPNGRIRRGDEEEGG